MIKSTGVDVLKPQVTSAAYQAIHEASKNEIFRGLPDNVLSFLSDGIKITGIKQLAHDTLAIESLNHAGTKKSRTFMQLCIPETLIHPNDPHAAEISNWHRDNFAKKDTEALNKLLDYVV